MTMFTFDSDNAMHLLKLDFEYKSCNEVFFSLQYCHFNLLVHKKSPFLSMIS